MCLEIWRVSFISNTSTTKSLTKQKIDWIMLVEKTWIYRKVLGFWLSWYLLSSKCSFHFAIKHFITHSGEVTRSKERFRISSDTEIVSFLCHYLPIETNHRLKIGSIINLLFSYNNQKLKIYDPARSSWWITYNLQLSASP